MRKSTDFEHSLKDIIELYPSRWLIELGIKTETKFFNGWGRIYNYEDKIVVCLSKKRSTGCLINAAFLDGWVDGGKYVSWLGKKLEFVLM